ncbi:MAG TPA: YfcE family phosphodiesterase [Gemmataceae bacterium]|jgi:putative phosphoesterase|nr:YfcE family phosphodiesterase [Gemmataceae bacterium]
MKIGVVSDTHGRLRTIAAALALLNERGAELLIHCGDIDDPEAARAFAGWDVHFVFGNCDADREGIARAIAQIGATLHESFGHLELAAKQIAWAHGHEAKLFHDLEHAGHYDYLFYGHTHVADQRRAAKTRVINPGALHRTREKTCLVVDLESDAIETVVVAV